MRGCMGRRVKAHAANMFRSVCYSPGGHREGSKDPRPKRAGSRVTIIETGSHLYHECVAVCNAASQIPPAHTMRPHTWRYNKRRPHCVVICSPALKGLSTKVLHAIPCMRHAPTALQQETSIPCHSLSVTLCIPTFQRKCCSQLPCAHAPGTATAAAQTGRRQNWPSCHRRPRKGGTCQRRCWQS